MGRKSAAVAVALAALAGCGSAPLHDVPTCGAEVHACSTEQMRGGTQCATCDDFNSSLGCQLHGADGSWRLASCVQDCAACDAEPTAQRFTDPVAAESLGVHVCGFDAPAGEVPRRRDAAWCAICGVANTTLTAELCDARGTCAPVVCVRMCDSCAPAAL